VDFSPPPTYVRAFAMLRKLLACLALLTGLAAAGAPAQAEVAVALAARVEASASGSDCAHQAGAAAPARTPARYARTAACVACGDSDLRLAPVSARVRVDRARE
jgi:hypothetical protein